MNDLIIATEIEKKDNSLLRIIQRHQVLTFTLLFLFIYRFVGALITYNYVGRESFVEKVGLSFGFFLIVTTASYVLYWLITAWIFSKHTAESLKEKLNRHPITTIFFIITYAVFDLPGRISETGAWGDIGASVTRIINIFEVTVTYTFMGFMWWLLACWLSGKVWKKRFEWLWYKKMVNKIFVFLPPLYKFVLGLLVAMLISYWLFVFLAGVSKYSGADLRKLLWD